MMNRLQQYYQFNGMVANLLWFARVHRIPIRLGEAHRPSVLSKIYSKGIDLWHKGVHLFSKRVSHNPKSKHIYSLAIDIWLTDDVYGKKIYWCGKHQGMKPEIDRVYLRLGIYWEKLGGRWGGRWAKPYDPYHFEWKGPIA